jgi:class 3 adenylate cyclase
LLVDEPESEAHGYLAIAHADAARARGDMARALSLVEHAKEIADRSADLDLPAWCVMRRGMFLVDAGRVDDGWPLIEDVAAAAAGGGLGSFTTGAILSNVVGVCRDLGHYRRGNEWSEAAMRWCERQRITGFPGVCRVNRAEMLRMLGRLQEAEEDARAAFDELTGFSPAHAAAAQHELGEVRLRLGDLTGAEDAFRRARELGEDPQPGLALLRLAQGDLEAAAASIRRSLQSAAFDRFARARLLPVQAEIARAADDAHAVRAARDEMAEIAGQVLSPAIWAAAEWTAGLLALVERDPASAAIRFRSSRGGWNEVGALIEAARATVGLAEALLADGDEEGAEGELVEARATFERLGAQLETRRVQLLLARVGREATPSRTVRTFLFTDIVGSTSLIELIGDDAWDDLRRWHDQALRSAFGDHGGEEIDHAGDGFFVAFPDAASGVACAVEIQRRLAEHRRTHGFAPMVRMGLHATEATRDQADYSGLGVHAAARIASLAAAGEVVASVQTLEGLPAVRWSNRRGVTLKGIVGQVEVVSIDWREAED